MKRHAFTLLELVVVIGVIAMLAAILLPELSAARSLARNALCRSNLRQLGTGFQDAASKVTAGTLAPTAYPNPNRYPAIPYSSVPNDRVFICPEDDPGNWNLVSGLKYHSYWGGYYWLDFADGSKAPNGQVCCRSRRGSDEWGGYTEFVFEENYDYGNGCDFWDRRSWHPAGPDYSDNDGLFRLWDDVPGRGRVLRLSYFNCSQSLQAFLFDEGIFEPSGALQGHVGEEVELGAFYTSYGINAKTHSHEVAPDTIVLLDYENDDSNTSFIADPDENGGETVRRRLDVSGRHRGKVNVLYADQSVGNVWPAELYPVINPGPWSPER